MPLMKQLSAYIRAAFTGLWVESHEHEDALIDHYVAELGHRGIELDPRVARDQYRALSFQTLMVAVVSIGLGSLTERDDTVRTVLRRSVAAIDRLDFADWLAKL